MKKESLMFLGFGVVVVILIVVSLFLVNKDPEIPSEPPEKPLNYEPKAFSTYVASSLKASEDTETGENKGVYSGKIIFRSDSFKKRGSRICYKVLEEDQSLFPELTERVCATNEIKQVEDIHAIGGVQIGTKQRYLITLLNPVIEDQEAVGMVIQVRTRDRQEDDELTAKTLDLAQPSE